MTRRLLPGLLRESVVYGIGGVANQALNIILVPIYARQLATSGYGVVAVINATLSLASMIGVLALPWAFFRSYLKEATTEQEKAHVLAVTAALRLTASIIFLGLFSLVAVPLTLLVFGGDSGELPLILLIGPIVFFDSVNTVPLSYLRAQRRPGPYVAISFTRVDPRQRADHRFRRRYAPWTARRGVGLHDLGARRDDASGCWR